MRFVCINARYVRNKAMAVSDFVVEKNIDGCSITETWLNEDSADQVVCGELTPSGYKLEHIARSTGKGGGVAILHR